MKKVRLGIIGMGNMGIGHLQNVIDGKCPKIEVTAVADVDPQKLDETRAKYPALVCFSDMEEMLDSGLIDATLIAVPHYDHPDCAIACFKRGIHVMIEKPAGVYTGQVRRMNEAAGEGGGVLLNQAPHNLDLWQWIFGMSKKIRAF